MCRWATDWALRLFGFAMTDDSFLVNPNSPRLNGGVNDNDPDIAQTEKYGVRAALAGNISEQLSLYATLRYNELRRAQQYLEQGIER